MSLSSVYAGVDVSKANLAASIRDWGYREFENSPKGIEKLLHSVRDIPNLVICCEASGGYEQELLEACLKQNIACCLVSPSQVRYWARSQNILAKTDKIDAKTIREYAENSKIRLLEAPNPVLVRLRALTRERQFEVERLTALGNHARLQQQPDLKRMNRAQIRAAEKRIQRLEDLIDDVIESNVSLKNLIERLELPKGIGRTTSVTVLAEFPFLGQMGPQSVSTLAGLVPFNNDSGKFKGRRRIRGGNARVRRVLYLAAVSAIRSNPILSALYLRLRNKGKEAKVALVAVARKLVRLMERIAADPGFQPS
jgi:transposase